MNIEASTLPATGFKMDDVQEKATVPLTNTVIKDQIESIREKLAEIKLPIENDTDNHKLNTEKSQIEKPAPEKFDFPPDLNTSDVKVTKVFFSTRFLLDRTQRDILLMW